MASKPKHNQFALWGIEICRNTAKFCCSIVVATTCVCQNVCAEQLNSLTLEKVEEIALKTSPEVAQIKYKEQALREAAVAEGELPDPTLQAGIINVPTDSFNLKQENMTQIKFGIAQVFPKGRSLSIKSQQKELMAKAEQFKGRNIQATILLTVRLEWLEIYYWTQSEKIVDDMISTFRHLVRVTEFMLAANKKRQHDVYQAQLELSKTENRLIQIEQEIATQRAKLGRWIGQDIANQALPDQLPNWPKPHPKQFLQQTIAQHPHIQSDASQVEASRQEVAHAEEQYKPGWKLGLHYSVRQGKNTGRKDKRADFVGAQIGLELPIFTAQRQDRRLAQSLANLNATRQSQESNYRRMMSEVEQQYSIWEKLSQQSDHYINRLLPEAELYAQATLPAYQNLQSDFASVTQAFVVQLETQLKDLRIRVDLAKARAVLFYLEGTHS